MTIVRSQDHALEGFNQGSGVKSQRLKYCLIFLLLLTSHFSLLAVLLGCGKKAPPKPPTALVDSINNQK